MKVRDKKKLSSIYRRRDLNSVSRNGIEEERCISFLFAFGSSFNFSYLFSLCCLTASSASMLLTYFMPLFLLTSASYTEREGERNLQVEKSSFHDTTWIMKLLMALSFFHSKERERGNSIWRRKKLLCRENPFAGDSVTLIFSLLHSSSFAWSCSVSCSVSCFMSSPFWSLESESTQVLMTFLFPNYLPYPLLDEALLVFISFDRRLHLCLIISLFCVSPSITCCCICSLSLFASFCLYLFAWWCICVRDRVFKQRWRLFMTHSLFSVEQENPFASESWLFEFCSSSCY